jgi:hypothetical protein
MSIRIVPSAIACLLALTAASHAAQTIASPAAYGSTFQQKAQCSIGNISMQPIAVEVRIVDEAGNDLPVNSTCGSIEPNFICQATATIPFNQAVACTAKTPGSADKLRGFTRVWNPLAR